MLGVAPALMVLLGGAEVRLEGVRFEKSPDSVTLIARLSGEPVHKPQLRRVGAYVALSIPGARAEKARDVLDVRDPLFSQAVVLAREGQVLVAVRAAADDLARRARVEVRGSEARLLLYRSAEALRAAEASSELERELERAASAESRAGKDAHSPGGPAAPTTGTDSSAAGSGSAARSASPATPLAAASRDSASKAGTAPRPLAAPQEPPFGAPARTLAALGLLALAVVTVFWYVRRGRARGGRGRSLISVLAAQPVGGGKRHLLLVEVQGEHFLLGSAEGGIRLLAKVDAPRDESRVPPVDGPPGGGLARFFGRLREGWLGRAGAKGPRPVAAGGAAGDLRAADDLRTAGDVPMAGDVRATGNLRVAGDVRPAGNRRAAGDVRATAADGQGTAEETLARGPAWTVALSEAMAARPPRGDDPASGAAELIRRKLAELNRA